MQQNTRMGMPTGEESHRSTDTSRTAGDSVMIIGVGNAYRHDDGVGRYVVETLGALNSPNVVTRVTSGEGTDLMNMWQAMRAVIVVDAALSGAPPGTIHRMDASKHSLPPVLFARTTHAFGLADAIELSRLLGNLPSALVVYGIEGQDFGMGDGMSREVEQAVPEAVAQILDETRRM
jgi:hydrogenase maturation protease